MLKKRIGIDVTGLVRTRHVTGIERVLIEINKGLSRHLDEEIFEIAPFCTIPGVKKPEQLSAHLADDPIVNKPLQSLDSFDILFFGGINANLPMSELMRLRREKNLKVVTLVHDIMPISHPEWFPNPEFASGGKAAILPRNLFQIYLQSTFAISDHLVLTSQHVKDEIDSYNWNRRPETSVIPLGAFQISSSITKTTRTRVNAIYVSTVTIRKGHAELLSAFDLLWAGGVDIILTIVGSKGWLIDDFIERLRTHPELGARLFWKEHLSDEEVTEIYKETDIAFIVSEDEGFGLALEEGLASGAKVIARDIPVFRERLYPNLYFFSGGPSELSATILDVIPLPFEKIPDGLLRTFKDFNLALSEIIKMLR